MATADACEAEDPAPGPSAPPEDLSRERTAIGKFPVDPHGVRRVPKGAAGDDRFSEPHGLGNGAMTPALPASARL